MGTRISISTHELREDTNIQPIALPKAKFITTLIIKTARYANPKEIYKKTQRAQKQTHENKKNCYMAEIGITNPWERTDSSISNTGTSGHLCGKISIQSQYTQEAKSCRLNPSM